MEGTCELSSNLWMRKPAQHRTSYVGETESFETFAGFRCRGRRIDSEEEWVQSMGCAGHCPKSQSVLNRAASNPAAARHRYRGHVLRVMSKTWNQRRS